MRRLLYASLLLSLSMLAGCQREKTDYISVEGKIFIFNIRLARAYYTLNLNRLASTPDDALVRAEFENPAGGPPLVSVQKVFPNMARIDLESPDLTCVVAGKPYAIHIVLTNAGGTVLQTLDTTLTSTLDQTVMPAQSLVVGNAYDKNPEAFDKAGNIKFRQACKAS